MKFVGGNCSSYNVIYIFTCKICSKCYVGRSTRPLKTRVGEHRRSFYKLCDKKEVDLNSDEFALAITFLATTLCKIDPILMIITMFHF